MHTKAEGQIRIAGVGLVSPLGTSVWATFRALCSGRSIADRCAELPADMQDCVALVRAVGGVSCVQHAAIDPAIDLAERAAREALFEAGVSTDALSCYIGTSKGAVSALTGFLQKHRHSGDAANAHESQCAAMQHDARPYMQHTLAPAHQFARALALGPCGFLSHALQERLSVRVIRHDVAACASSLMALHAARQDMLHRGIPSAIVVTSESAMLPMFIHSYRRLGALASPYPQSYRSRPLDVDRQGFMLGEFGAAVVLQKITTPQPDDILLRDTAVAAEAYDLVRPSPQMPALSSIARQLFTDRRIDVIHPHAPGTADQDEVELRQYAHALGASSAPSHLPSVYACKGALGHGLGSAGLVSLVLAALCSRAGMVPPMPWIEQPMDSEIPIQSRGNRFGGQSTHAVFAAGFGGHVAGAVIEKL